MNIDLKTVTTQLAPALAFIKKYALLIMFVLVLGTYSFLVLDINRLTSAEPSDDAIQEKLKTVQVPKLDSQTLKKIKDLQDQNVEVKSLFDQARQNPFSEPQ